MCPYNAIVEVMRPCKRVCPTGALEINPDDKRAMIEKENCINCGACMAACPFGAISDKSYIVNITRLLKEKKKSICGNSTSYYRAIWSTSKSWTSKECINKGRV